MISKSSTIVETNWFYMRKRRKELARLKNRYNISSTLLKPNGFICKNNKRSGHIDTRNHQ